MTAAVRALVHAVDELLSWTDEEPGLLLAVEAVKAEDAKQTAEIAALVEEARKPFVANCPPYNGKPLPMFPGEGKEAGR